MFERLDTNLPGVCILRPKIFRDARGYFFESYHEEKLAALGIDHHFVQDNQSLSTRHTLRGLHYQIRHPQAKLCRVLRGEVLDVAVDVRRGSPTFGRWTSSILSAENTHQMFVPIGFAHGFVVLSGEAEFFYKCSDFYDREGEQGVLWSDPDLGIDWGIREPLVSEKDARNPRLAEIPVARLFEYSR